METTRVTIDGSGSFGELESWSVTENATPIAPGDPAAGSGGVQFSGSAEDDSDFLTGDDYALTHEAYGTVSGAITRADLGPLQASLSGDNLITRLSAVRTVPPGGAALGQSFGVREQGYIYSPADLFTGPDDHIYSLTQSPSLVARFDKDMNYLNNIGGQGSGNNQYNFNGYTSQGVYDPETNEIYIADSNNNRVKVIDPETLLYKRQFTVTGVRGITIHRGEIMTIVSGAIRRYSKSGVLLGTLVSSPELNGAMGKLYSDGNYIYASDGTRAASFTSEGYLFAVSPNPWRFGATRPVSSFNNGVMYVTWGQDEDNNSTRQFQMLSTPYLQPMGPIGPTFTGTTYLTTAAITFNSEGVGYLYIERDPTITTNPVELLQSPVPTPLLSTLMQRYLDSLDAGLTLDYQATNDPHIAAPGWSDSVWTKLNELCVAHGVEIGIDDGTIVVRDIGVGTLETEDATPVSRNVSAEGASRFVDVQYTNATAGVGTVYDASKDGQGRTFEVNVRETKIEPIQTSNYPVAIQQPQRVNTFPVRPGQYYLIGSDNLPVAAGQFEDFGGSVSVSLSETAPGTLDLRLEGPIRPIPGVSGPFRLAISDGSNSYPAFSIVGSGIFTSPVTARLSTGADWSQVTSQATSSALSNPFIANRAQALNRGRWAAVKASGPNVSVTFSVSYENSNGFGLTAGSTFEAYDAIWRVDSVSFGAMGFQVQASLYTTFGDVQPLWDGETVGDFALAWDGKKIKDFRVRPLANAVD